MPQVHFVGQLHSAVNFPTTSALFAKWTVLPTPVSGSAWSSANDANGGKATAAAEAGEGAETTTADGDHRASPDLMLLAAQPAWRHSHGLNEGRTWIAEPWSDGRDTTWTWNHVIDVGFVCTSLVGWPSLLVEVYEHDKWGRIDLAGYGVTRLPLAVGEYERSIVVARPKGSRMQELSARFIGGKPRYVVPQVLLSADSRHAHHTQSVGMVRFHINVVHGHFQTLPHVWFTAARVPNVPLCTACPTTRRDDDHNKRSRDAANDGDDAAEHPHDGGSSATAKRRGNEEEDDDDAGDHSKSKQSELRRRGLAPASSSFASASESHPNPSAYTTSSESSSAPLLAAPQYLGHALAAAELARKEE